jgi:copper resistance protein C
MRLRGRTASALAALALAVVSATVFASPASAHDYLVSSSPAAGSTISEAPNQVSLTFDDVVLFNPQAGIHSLVVVTDAKGNHFETGCSSALDRVVNVPVSLGGAGTYKVTWDIVSADGHPVTNSIDFTYAPKGGAASSTNAGSAKSPCQFVASGQSIKAPGQQTSAQNSASNSSAIAVIVISVGGTAVIVALVVVIWLLATRRRNQA